MDTTINSMSKDSTEVEELMKEYIGSGKPASLSLRQHLKSLDTETKFSVVCSVRGASVNWTGVAMAVFICDLDGLEAMLDGFTEEQQYTILKLGDDDGDTPLHCAVYDRDNNDTRYTIKDVLIYLLNDISPPKIFELLKTQNNSGDTMLHCATFYKEMEALQVIFSTLSSQEKEVLLSLRNCKGVSVGDLSVPALLATSQDLKATKEQFYLLHDHCCGQTLELAATKNKVEAMRTDQIVLRTWSEHNTEAVHSDLEETNQRLRQLEKATLEKLNKIEKRFQESQSVAKRKRSSLLANGRVMKKLQNENYKLQREKHDITEEHKLIHEALIELERKSDGKIKELEKEREKQATTMMQMNLKMQQLEAYVYRAGMKDQISVLEPRFSNVDHRGSCLTVPKSLHTVDQRSSTGAEHRSFIRTDQRGSNLSNQRYSSKGDHKCAITLEHSSSSVEEHICKNNSIGEYRNSSTGEHQQVKKKGT